MNADDEEEDDDDDDEGSTILSGEPVKQSRSARRYQLMS